MNKHGLKFCEDMNRLLKEYNKDKDIEDKWHPPSQWQDSAVQERIMRLGCEARTYSIDEYDSSNLQRMAVATLIADFLKKDILFHIEKSGIILDNPIE